MIIKGSGKIILIIYLGISCVHGITGQSTNVHTFSEQGLSFELLDVLNDLAVLQILIDQPVEPA